MSCRNERRDERGTVMLEALVCLPFLFLLLFMTAQLAHIMFCRQVIQYAAVAAGRAAVVAPENQEQEAAAAAARRICALVSFTNEGGTPLKRKWLEYGEKEIGGTGGAAPDADPPKLTVQVDGDGIPGTRKIEVQFQVPMLFPLVGDVLAGALELYPYPRGSSRNSGHYRYQGEYFRHIRLSGRTVVFKHASVQDPGINYREWN